MRLAWFSPMPPVRSGISVDSHELITRLRTEHAIDVFVDDRNLASAPGHPPLRSAHEFVWAHQQRPYDLTIYQLGNSSHHDFIWPYLFRYPGLTVLHDARLHHARAAMLLRRTRDAEYRAEFVANHPEIDADAAELAVAGFDSFLYYEWPFTRLVCSASRMTAVHSRLTCNQLRSELPGAAIEHLRLGHGIFVAPDEVAVRRTRARRRYGIPDSALLFGMFGGVTPDKRVPQILAAFELVLRYAPSAWLLLGGQAEHCDASGEIRRRGLQSCVTLTGYLETEDELTDCIAASDVTLTLRWPTAREISGVWLRCLAAGRPTIVIDLAQTADVPSLDPRIWQTHAREGEAPVTVAIDILDEDHSLRVAMRRLAADRALRDALGTAGREYWTRQHSHEVMIEDYRRLLPAAAFAPVPKTTVPAHLKDDTGGLLAAILGRFGVSVPWSKM